MGKKHTQTCIHPCKPKLLLPPGWKRSDLFNLPLRDCWVSWKMVPHWELKVNFFLLTGWNPARGVTVLYPGSFWHMCANHYPWCSEYSISRSVFPALCCHGWSQRVEDIDTCIFLFQTTSHTQVFADWGYTIQSSALRWVSVTDVFQGNLEWDHSSNTVLNIINITAGTHHISSAGHSKLPHRDIVWSVGLALVQYRKASRRGNLDYL